MSRLTYVLIIAIMLCGCSKEESINTDIISRSEAYKKYNEEQIKTNRTKIMYYSVPDQTGAKEALVNEFNKSQEDIYVQITYISESPTSRYIDIKNAAANDNSFDLFDSDFSYINTYINDGIPLNITDKTMGISFSDYYDNVAAILTSGQNVYALPNNISFALLYYRTDIVADIPKSHTDLANMLTQIKTDKATSNYVFAGKYDNGLYEYFMETMGIHSNAFSEYELRGLITTFMNIYFHDATATNVRTMSQTDANNYFLEGKSVFLRAYPNVWSFINKSGAKTSFAMASFPKEKEGQLANIIGQATMINKNTLYPNEAYRFLEYMCGVTGQKIMALYGSYPPTIKSLYNDSEIIAKNPHFKVESFVKNLEAPIKISDIGIQAKRTATEGYIYDILQGNISIINGIEEIKGLYKNEFSE